MTSLTTSLIVHATQLLLFIGPTPPHLPFPHPPASWPTAIFIIAVILLYATTCLDYVDLRGGQYQTVTGTESETFEV